MENIELFNIALKREKKPKFTFVHTFNVLMYVQGFAKPAKIELSAPVEVYTDKKCAVVAITKFDGIDKCTEQLLTELFGLPWRTAKFLPNNIVYMVRTEGKETIDIVKPIYEHGEITRVEWMFFDTIIKIDKA